MTDPPARRERGLGRLTWLGALVSLGAAAILLFGPLWDSAVGENPLARDQDLDIDAILSLALPTVVVLAAVVVVLAVRRPVVGAGALLVMAVAVLLAPMPLPWWFGPGLVITASGYAVRLRGSPGHATEDAGATSRPG